VISQRHPSHISQIGRRARVVASLANRRDLGMQGGSRRDSAGGKMAHCARHSRVERDMVSRLRSQCCCPARVIGRCMAGCAILAGSRALMVAQRHSCYVAQVSRGTRIVARLAEWRDLRVQGGSGCDGAGREMACGARHSRGEGDMVSRLRSQCCCPARVIGRCVAGSAILGCSRTLVVAESYSCHVAEISWRTRIVACLAAW